MDLIIAFVVRFFGIIDSARTSIVISDGITDPAIFLPWDRVGSYILRRILSWDPEGPCILQQDPPTCLQISVAFVSIPNSKHYNKHPVVLSNPAATQTCADKNNSWCNYIADVFVGAQLFRTTRTVFVCPIPTANRHCLRPPLNTPGEGSDTKTPESSVHTNGGMRRKQVSTCRK